LATLIFHPLAALLRVASKVICLTVAVSFAIFAVNQTGSASTHQQDELNGTPVAAATPTSTRAPLPHEGSVHRVIDEAAEAFTSPFSGITRAPAASGPSAGWAPCWPRWSTGSGWATWREVLRVRV
jgi:hypothetical protein